MLAAKRPYYKILQRSAAQVCVLVALEVLMAAVQSHLVRVHLTVESYMVIYGPNSYTY